MTCRYAIYFAPESGSALEEAGASCIGRNARTGWSGQPHPVEGITEERLFALTESPRRYGFHATLKAPFRLANDHLEISLIEAVSHLASRIEPFEMPQLSVSSLHNFVALIPQEESSALRDLADRCVSMLDAFRSPLTPEERERRKPDQLSSQQRNNLDRWGYPFVFDEYRFHMTLTGPVETSEAEQIIQTYQSVFEPVLAEATVANSITIFVQNEPDQPFGLRQRFPLGNTSVNKL